MDFVIGEAVSVEQVWNILTEFHVSKRIAIETILQALNEFENHYLFSLLEDFDSLEDDNLTLGCIWFTNGSQLMREYVDDYADTLFIEPYLLFSTLF